MKIPAQSAAHELRRDAFDAYLSTGGSLTLERERAALANAVTSAVKAGSGRDIVLAACRELGRENTFPGLLKQRIAAIVDRGGICDHEGLDRSRMTVTQLRACGCGRCTEWAEAHEATRERQPA